MSPVDAGVFDALGGALFDVDGDVRELCEDGDADTDGAIAQRAVC